MADGIGPKLKKYNIIKPLSTGGMGTVYLAEDTSLSRRVAIKVLSPEWAADPDRLQRFRWEAQILATLNHPNIVTIYSVEEADGTHFLTMELIDGETLADLIPSVGLPLARLFELAVPLADALSAAHEKGVIHRDLKPSNIMVGKDGRLKILDFGLAKQQDKMSILETEGPEKQPVTRDGQMIGTVPYMSPEQIQGDPADHRSDIFSLGIILYEMAAGVRPFQGKTWGDLASSILRDRPPSVTAYNVYLPRHLGRIIRHCLEKEPAKRFQTALDLKNELQELEREWQTGELSVTRNDLADIIPPPRSKSPQSKPTKPEKSSARDHEQRLAAVASIFVAMILVLILWTRLGREPSQEGTTATTTATEQRDPNGPRRIVVLPLENLGLPDQEYFAAGITEEITSRLAKVSALHVISRTTALNYNREEKTVQQIGDELGVDYLLEGSVRWNSSSDGVSRVRVTPQLVRVSDDTHLWSDRYDRVINDIFAVQSEIAAEVIRQMGIALQEPERRALVSAPTQNIGAYTAYLRGRDYDSRRDPKAGNWRLAVEMFERAVSLDPNFALAYAELSEVHSLVYHLIIDRTDERLLAAREAVDRALEIAPDLPAAHRALGYYYYWGHRDYDAALAEFDIAASALPNDSQLREGIAYIRRRQGRFEEAMTEFEKALELEPQSARLAAELGQTCMLIRRYEQADEYFSRSIDFAPEQPIPYQSRALNALLWRGDLAASRRWLEAMPKQQETSSLMAWYRQKLREKNYQAALDLIAATPVKIIGDELAMYPKNLLQGQVYRLMGETAQAQASLNTARFLLERIVRLEPDDPRRRSALAMAYAGLDRPEEAVRQAQRAVELLPVRKDAVNGPKFMELLAEINVEADRQDAAVDLLEQLLEIPAAFSRAFLALDPRWEPLHQHPRFQALIAQDAGG